MNREKEFDIGECLEQCSDVVNSGSQCHDKERFNLICKEVKDLLDNLDADEGNGETALERQRRAIIGEEKAVQFYKSKILDIVREKGYSKIWYPPWYESMEDAIYCETLGFAGITPWIEGRREEYRNSSSCKLIGDRVYYLINGRQQLQPVKISADRRMQLRAALLLPDPQKRRADPYHEVYLNDGTRVTMFGDNGMAKKNQDCIIFRKFFVKTYTFEEQAKRHTIPEYSIELFKNMIRIGFNVVFIGAVRTSKTTFLTTWQSYEDQCLEGVQLEKDPEIPLHEIMPEAPIMQLVPDDEHFETVITQIMRSDADYINIAEAREGRSLYIGVKAANKGTRHQKMTFHSTDPIDFCYDVADEILKIYGGDLASSIIKVAKSFQYLFQFVQLSDKSKKRLKGIWEVRYDRRTREITMHNICRYRYETDDWVWSYDIGKDKFEIGAEEDMESMKNFDRLLKTLAEKYPDPEEHEYHPAYGKLLLGGGERDA